MEFTLHLGAHRTGTTALQQACNRNAGRLAQAGWAFWGPGVMRERGLGSFFAVAARAESDPRAARDMRQTRGIVRQGFRDLKRDGARNLLISEENLPGNMRLNFERRALYPRVGERLPVIAGLFPRPPRAVFFAIRDYADYWASAYAFAALRNDLDDMDAMRAALAAGPRGWAEVLADVRAAFPDSPVLAWVHARTPGLLAAVLRRMLGPVAGEMRMPQGWPNAGVSAAGLAEGLRLRRAQPGITPAALRAQLAAAARPDDAPFRPFSADQADLLHRRFARDRAALAAGAVEGVELIEPLATAGGVQ